MNNDTGNGGYEDSLMKKAARIWGKEEADLYKHAINGLAFYVQKIRSLKLEPVEDSMIKSLGDDDIESL